MNSTIYIFCNLRKLKSILLATLPIYPQKCILVLECLIKFQ